MTDQELKDAYDSNIEIRAIADKIHEHRLMGGPACTQCIEMAMRRLKLIDEDTAQSASDRMAIGARTGTLVLILNPELQAERLRNLN